MRLIALLRRLQKARETTIVQLKVWKRPIPTMRLYAITDSVFGKPDSRYDCAYHSGKTSWYFRITCVIRIARFVRRTAPAYKIRWQFPWTFSSGGMIFRYKSPVFSVKKVTRPIYLAVKLQFSIKGWFGRDPLLESFHFPPRWWVRFPMRGRMCDRVKAKVINPLIGSNAGEKFLRHL